MKTRSYIPSIVRNDNLSFKRLNVKLKATWLKMVYINRRCLHAGWQNVILPNSISKDTQGDITFVFLESAFYWYLSIISKTKFDKDSWQDLENKFSYRLKENMSERKHITPYKVRKYINI